VYDGNRYIQKYRVNAVHAIPEFADIGGQVQAKLLGWPDIDNDGASDMEDENDRDSVIGTHNVLDDTISNKKDAQPSSWNSFKGSFIPEYVKGITFTVDEANMTAARHEELRTRFPDVLIQSNSPREDGTHQPAISEIDKLKQTDSSEQSEKLENVQRREGVKSTTFEMSPGDMDKSSGFSTESSRISPWAAIQNIAVPQEPKAGLAEIYSSGHIPNPPPQNPLLPPCEESPCPGIRIIDQATSNSARHLYHLATNVLAPPMDNCFGYRYSISSGWDLLSPNSKINISHARCIMAHYGEYVAPSCTGCSQRGYLCRVYRRDFSPVPGLDLGHGCQNCRVWGQPCDLPAAKLTSVPKSGSQQYGFSPIQTILDMQGPEILHPHDNASPRLSMSVIKPVFSMAERREETATNLHQAPVHRYSVSDLSTTASKPSVIDKVSNPSDPGLDTNLRIRGLANEAEPGNQGGFQMNMDNVPETTASSPPILRDRSSENLVYYVAEELGLSVSSPQDVQSMYNFWHKRGKIRSKGKLSLDDYYGDLLTLCIIGKHINDSNLQCQVLLKWQETDYKYRANSLPDTSIAIRAFQYLPGSSLCKWITIIYSFLWPTAESGDFETFCRETSNADDEKDIQMEPIAAFLHSIALMRCAYTKGNDMNVLPMWCDVHDHTRGGSKEAKCIEFRDRISDNLMATQLEQQDEEALDKAKELIAKSGGQVIWKAKTDLANRGKSVKRKSEEPLEGGMNPKKRRGRGGPSRGG
jgi:hypothetical protein